MKDRSTVDVPLTIRRAQPDEIPATAAIYVDADRASAQFARALLHAPAEGDRSGTTREAIDDLATLVGKDTDTVLLAFGGPQPVGMAGVVVRGRHAHITYLFVHPDWQGHGIGRALLDQLRGYIAAAGCDVTSLYASRDPRALQRYLRYGLHPAPPMISLVTARPSFPSLDLRDGLDAHPLRADDAALLATLGDIDAVVRGVRRPADLRRWLEEGAEGALLTRRDTAVPAGYYLCSVAKHGRGVIGPAAAIDVERVPAVLARALAGAATLPGAGSAEWWIHLPAENSAALAPLFAAGLQARQLTPYLATGPIGRWDRYVFHDANML
jgi:GNAT superfamily N-acetyltransferase